MGSARRSSDICSIKKYNVAMEVDWHATDAHRVIVVQCWKNF